MDDGEGDVTWIRTVTSDSRFKRQKDFKDLKEFLWLSSSQEAGKPGLMLRPRPLRRTCHSNETSTDEMLASNEAASCGNFIDAANRPVCVEGVNKATPPGGNPQPGLMESSSVFCPD